MTTPEGSTGMTAFLPLGVLVGYVENGVSQPLYHLQKGKGVCDGGT